MKITKIILFFLILFLYGLTNVLAETVKQGKYQIEILPQDKWVLSPETITNSDAIEASQGIKYLLKSEQFNFVSPEKEVYQRVRMEVSSAEGLKEASKLNILYNPAFEQLHLNNITVIRNNKVINKLLAQNIQLIQREEEIESGIYNGNVTAFVLLDDIRVGDIVDYSYTLIGSNPVLGEKKYTSFNLNYGVDLGRLFVRVINPTDKKIYLDQNYGNDNPVKKVRNHVTALTWDLKSIKAITVEDRLPSWYNPLKTIYVSQYKNWSQVSSWANHLFDINYDTPLVKKTVASLHLQGLSKKEQVSKILQFVQEDIRYFGLELGMNSHKPHLPDTTISKRFGDCKDKSILMVALLKQIGVSAYPALVSSFRGFQIDKIQPSPALFNHVITKVIIDGKTYWLDGTALHQKGNLDDIAFFNYHNALVIKPHQRKLTPIKRPANKKSTIQVVETIDMEDYDKPAKLQIESIYKGRQAEIIRSSISRNGEKDLSKYYFNYFSSIYQDVKIDKPIKIKDDHKNNVIIVEENYTIGKFLQVEKNRRSFETIADAIVDYVQLPKMVSRKMPLNNYFPTQVNQQISVSLPNDVKWSKDKLVENVNSQYLNYKRTITSNANHLNINYHYQPLSYYVDAKNSKSFTEDLSKIKQSLNRSFEVPGFYDMDVNKRTDNLKSLVKKLLKRK